MKKLKSLNSREQFEQFQKKNSPCRDLERDGDRYKDPNTQRLWSTWLSLQDEEED